MTRSVLLRRVMIALSIIGIGVATYLTVVHYVGFQLLACTGGGAHSSCQTVQSSEWSELAGIPVALVGLIGYIGILGTLLLRDREESRLATLGLTLIGFAFSGYLTYRELFSIHAICEWCVSSAAIMTILFMCSVARYLLGQPSPRVSTPSRGVDGGGVAAPDGRPRDQLVGPTA